MNVYGYARISEDDEKLGRGVARQSSDIFDHAQLLKLPAPTEIIVDNDRSASRYSKKKRPGYERLVSLLESATHPFTVIFWDVERLLRQPRDLEHLIDLADKNPHITLHSFTGELDLRTSDGRFVARILVAKAAKESDDISKRVKRLHQDRVRDLLPHGPASFGYHYVNGQLALHPTQAPILREMIDRALAGESLSSIARDLNARGIPRFKTTTPWQANHISRLVTTPRSAGLRSHNGRIVSESPSPHIPAVSSTTEWATLCELLSRRFDAPQGQPVRVYFLSGIPRCARCDLAMYAAPTVGRDRANKPKYHSYRYLCNHRRGGCSQSIVGPAVEDYVIERLLHQLQSPLVREALGETRAPRHTFDAEHNARIEQRLAELHAAYFDTSARMTREQYVKLRDNLEAQLQTPPPIRPNRKLPSTRTEWDELSITQRASLAKLLIRNLTIRPGSRSIKQPLTRISLELQDFTTERRC